MTPHVKILVSCPNPAHIDACTLVFETLRTGFPTAPINIEINSSHVHTHNRVIEEVYARAKAVQGMTSVILRNNLHHATWIEEKMRLHNGSSPLVILDADTIFWSSVEDWTWDEGTLLAGYYVPRMWNDFAKCVSLSRIHTSFMWFPNVNKLRELIKIRYPCCNEKAGEYCPFDPFMPEVRFIGGDPYFWDTCSNLYQMLGSSHCQNFAQPHLDCFEHLNSASFFDVMKERLEEPQGFEFVHRKLATNAPEVLKGRLWPITDRYYKLKAIQGSVSSPQI